MHNYPLIIGGFYRSGTTLIRRLLDSHSRIHCGPEVKFFKDFYGDYQDDSLAHVRLFSSARFYGLPDSVLLKIFGNAFIQFHEAAALKASKVRWADKNPDNVFYLNHWATLLPQGFIFINVVRNPLDALASLIDVGFEKTVPSAFEEKVRLYRRFRELASEYYIANLSTSIEVSYESLVSNPVECVKSIMVRLNEKFEPAQLDNFAAVERGFGIEDPKASLRKDIHKESIGRGSRELSYEQKEIVSQQLAEFL